EPTVYSAEKPGYGRKRGTRQLDVKQGACLGPACEQTGIERRLSESGVVSGVVDDAGLIGRTAAHANGQAAGWHRGRTEFGRCAPAIMKNAFEPD
ncbi:MAG: hypothetical protein ACRECZ_08690, partial [Methylocella sp.]